MTRPAINTTHVFPPIPMRDHDWCATTEDYDGAPDAGPQLIGWGRTEQDAIADLREQMDPDLSAAALCKHALFQVPLANPAQDLARAGASREYIEFEMRGQR